MGVILVDLGDDKHHLSINWWNWRPVLAFLSDAGLIDDEQFERLGANGCGGTLTPEQSQKAAEYLTREILPRLQDGQQIHADGQISPVPSTSRPISSLPTHELYALSKTCLESFIPFCQSCKGFKVL
jgi:hypothetical protein